MTGRTVGKYRLAEKVGRGGMGTVYRGVDTTLERDVAIKVLHSDIAESEGIKRFRAEALMLARLNHPGIATVYDLCEEEGDLLLVMEFVRGETLQRLSERAGPLPLSQAMALSVQALDALSYAHGLGVVHRDLKPSNLMLSDAGLVKVMDFGIARIVGSEHLTCHGSMMGTPAFMAPEQVRGGEIDARADLYAMGVVLYRLLTARLPFEADTAVALAQKQLSDPPTPLKVARPDLPAWCEALLARALAKSAADRFQSAAEFKAALGTALGPAITMPVRPAAFGDATTCTMPTPISVGTIGDELKRPSGVMWQTPGSPFGGNPPGEATPGTPRTVVISGKYFFAGTGVLATLIVVLLVAVLVALRRPPATLPGAPIVSPRTTPVSQGQSVPPQSVPAPLEARPEVPRPNSALRTIEPPQPARAADATTAASSASNPTTQTAGSGAANAALQSRTTSSPAVTRVAAPGRSLAAEKLPAGRADVPTRTTGNPNTAAAVAPALPFDRLKLLVVDGGRGRERDVTVQFADGRVTLTGAGDRQMASFAYGDVLTLSYSRSRQPKWRNANGSTSRANLSGGPFGFFKSDRTWFAMQTKAHTFVVRADGAPIEPLMRAAAERTGLAIYKLVDK